MKEALKSIIEELVSNNLYQPYRGANLSSKDVRLIKLHELNKIEKAIDNKNDYSLIPYVNGEQNFIAIISKVDFLSNYFEIPIGVITQLVCTSNDVLQNYTAGKVLASGILDLATRKLGIEYISVNVPVENIGLIRALEQYGFRYTEGFINMVNTTGYQVLAEKQFEHVEFHEAIESDLYDIEHAYAESRFPSRFLTEEGFDDDDALSLYSHRFREVYNKDIGYIIVVKIKDKFAGAIIVAIDEELYKYTGLKLNLRSGMGLIIDPKMRGMLAGTALVNHRQGLYKAMGVQNVSLGTNISNKPMIICLEKLGFKYGCQELTMSRWINI